MKRPYQDIWRDGKLVQAGRRECTRRYKAIRDVLEAELGHGFSVADVGGWDGYFPTRLAEDLSAQAVNIDSRHVAIPNHRRLTVTAETVGSIGYHDAILCLSVLHHMEDWRAIYAGLRAQCLLLFVEVCHPGESMGKLSRVMHETAHRIAEQHAVVRADSCALVVETPCLDRPTLKRPTFLVRRGVRGTVASGLGKAAGGMAKTGDEPWSALGYVPFPGTLNLTVTAAGRNWLKSLPGVKAPGLGRSTKYVPVRVSGVDCHVHFARGKRAIELVAPVCLRSALGCVNGNRLDVTVRP